MLDGNTEAMNEPQQNELMCKVLADGGMMLELWLVQTRQFMFSNCICSGRKNDGP